MLETVQILRAVAALMVAALHIQHDAALLAMRTGEGFFVSNALPWMAGVDIFFVISGFIMVHAARGSFAQPGATRVFLARRVARIVPIYWLATTLLLGVSIVLPGALNSTAPGWNEIVASYLFVPFQRADGLVQPVFSLGWTLNYEMFFYVLFGLCLALPRRLAVATAAFILIGLVTVGALVTLPTVPAFWSRPIVLEFALGMAIGLARAEGLRLHGTIRLALAGLGAALLAADFGDGGGQTGWTSVFAYGLPAACLVAACGLGGAERDGSASGPVPARVAVAVGDASYALYLLHPFVSRGLRIMIERAGLTDWFSAIGFIALAMACSVMVALVAHRVFEVPVTRVTRRLLGG